jgi:hypothetical protein
MVQAATAESAIAGAACAIRPHVEDSGHLAGHRQEELEFAPPAIAATGRTMRTLMTFMTWARKPGLQCSQLRCRDIGSLECVPPSGVFSPCRHPGRCLLGRSPYGSAFAGLFNCGQMRRHDR